jgi:hypothetical protein
MTEQFSLDEHTIHDTAEVCIKLLTLIDSNATTAKGEVLAKANHPDRHPVLNPA